MNKQNTPFPIILLSGLPISEQARVCFPYISQKLWTLPLKCHTQMDISSAAAVDLKAAIKKNGV